MHFAQPTRTSRTHAHSTLLLSGVFEISFRDLGSATSGEIEITFGDLGSTAFGDFEITVGDLCFAINSGAFDGREKFIERHWYPKSRNLGIQRHTYEFALIRIIC